MHHSFRNIQLSLLINTLLIFVINCIINTDIYKHLDTYNYNIYTLAVKFLLKEFMMFFVFIHNTKQFMAVINLWLITEFFLYILSIIILNSFTILLLFSNHIEFDSDWCRCEFSWKSIELRRNCRFIKILNE